ncbi:DUF1554 domain-containing protein [bacterium]|nr:DUF1554 domain-containing protein [bacterium]
MRHAFFLSAFVLTLVLASCGRGLSVSPAVFDPDPPSLVTLEPESSYLVTAPTSIVATFNQAVTALTAAHFTIGGTCTTAPTVSTVVMSGVNTVATATLTGGSCTNGQDLTVTLDPTQITTAGVAGTGSAETTTYSISTIGPAVTLDSPTDVALRSGESTDIQVNFADAASGGTALTGDLTVLAGGVTLTGTSSCTLGVSSISTTGAVITASGCSNGTFTVHVDAGVVEDALGNASAVSAESDTITVFNGRVIFVTTGTHNGNYGGYSGTNTYCNNDSAKPSTGIVAGSTYKALLDTNNATTSGITYYRTDLTTVIATATGGNLVGSAGLTNPISTGATAVWTGSDANKCNGWTAPTIFVGALGIANSGTATWWANSSAGCANTRALYCVEQ